MSAPSVLHEERRAELVTVFRLAGLTRPAHLPWWFRPDVSLAAPSLRVLGLGDAKATERPGDNATLRRLVGYVRAARGWNDAGWDVHMSLVVAPADDQDWLGELRRAWSVGGLAADHETMWEIHPGSAVVSLSTSRVSSSTNVGSRPNLEV